ncbi:MAG: AEC family transporter [Acidimicrobiia bacterium]
MSNFLILIEKIYPLYVIICFGYIAGKFLKVERDSIAKIAIYFVAPVVVFNSFATMPKGNTYLLLPVIFFSVAMIIACAYYLVGSKVFTSSERNLLSASVGSGNTGYFGIPLILAVFGERYLNIAVISTLGLIIYENTFAYFLISKSEHTLTTSLKKMAMLPSIYTCLFGIIINKSSVTLPENIVNTITYFRGAYVVLGMMIVGIALSTVTKASLDIKFGALAFSAKFIIYPLIISLFIFLDNKYFGLYPQRVHEVLLVLSIVPMAANVVSFASHLKVHPEKIAAVVFASTAFALFYLPLFISIFISH